jgi:peroxiredoxin
MRVSTILPALLVLVVGCAAEVDAPFDGDQDGLLDHEEEEARTDPANPDSDGDNHLDGDEWLAGTDPLDPDDHPYHGGWTIDGDCRGSIQASGGADAGDVATGFRLLDQHGDRVKLHDFCGQVVVLKRSTGWCGACRGSEPDLVALFDSYRDRGLMAITLLSETDAREAPAQEDLQAWADQYGANHAVVADTERVGGVYERDGGIPSYVLLGPGAVIEAVDEGFPSAEAIEALLPE